MASGGGTSPLIVEKFVKNKTKYTMDHRILLISLTTIITISQYNRTFPERKHYKYTN